MTNLKNEANIKPIQRLEFNERDASIGSIVFVLLQYGFLILFSMLISAGLVYTDVVSTIASVLLEGMFAVTVWVVARAQRVSWVHATTLNKKPQGIHFAWAVLLALVCLFCFTALTNAFLEILVRLGYATSDMQNPDSALTVTTFGQLVLYTFTIALVPAFTEELLFRGLLYKGFSTLGKHAGVWLSAVLFMLMHGSPDQTVHQLILGVVLGYTFMVTGSIYIPMFIHFLNNFIVLVINYMAYASGAMSAVGEEAFTTSASLLFTILQGVLLAVLGGVIIYFVLQHLQRKQKASIVQQAEPNEALAPTQVSAGKRKLDVASIICLSLSLFVLVLAWVISLITGFGV